MNRQLDELPWFAPLLYVPGNRPGLASILRGEKALGVCSLAVCLEDAVHPEDRLGAAKMLCRVLQECARPVCPVLVRPCGIDSLEWLLEHLPLEKVHGFLLPKATVAKIHLWVERSGGMQAFLPILESREALDPIGRRELAQACAAHRPLIPAVRIGANDLFALLGGLRRPRGRTIYETPLRHVVDALVEAFSAHEIKLCGSVFDRTDDLATLAREVAEDVERGLFAKTAIHPSQLPVIWDGYAPGETEIVEARQLLLAGSPAVFGMHGAMLETACHSEWARRLLARSELHAIASRTAALSLGSL
jgi:citrate lyase beta subunit